MIRYIISYQLFVPLNNLKPTIMIKRTLLLAAFAVACCGNLSAKTKVHEEVDGFVLIEAEDYARQSNDKVRQWVAVDSEADIVEYECKYKPGASGGKYMQILPDTRRTHKDKLVPGENFAKGVGDMAVLSYKVNFTMPGRYYVWVSCFSSNSEDNGVHVGINGTWHESGQRMQWCSGKHQWFWGSSQRVSYNHCGVPGKIWIDVPSAGVHTIEFSMREDGFAMDRFALTKMWNLSKKSDLVGEVVLGDKLPMELLK